MTPGNITLTHYQLLLGDDQALREIGRGARDVTYSAVDLRLDRPVALRLLPDEYADIPGARDEFVREVRLLARLQHPHIAALLSLAPPGGPCFCTFELPSPETMASLVRSGPVEPMAALYLLDQANRALHEIWQQGLVITDLHPGQLTLVRKGHEILVRLSGFHVAEAGASVAPPPAARPFASPEQQKAAALDIRSNLFSLGRILHHLLGGGTPGLELPPEIPQKITRLFDALTAPEPVRRIQTPFELEKTIRQCLRGAPPPSATALGIVGDQLARHFTLDGPLEGGEGHHFEARDVVHAQDAIVHLFGPDEPERRVQLALEVARKVAARPHPGVLRVLEAVDGTDQRYVAYERVYGICLLDVLRRRRQLPLAEVLLLVDQLAAVADHAITAEISGLDFSIATIRLALPPTFPSAQLEPLVERPLPQWPAFVVKIAPFGSYPKTAAPVEPSPSADRLRELTLRAVAATLYELLGGNRLRLASPTPVASLSENGNRILRQLLTENALPLPSAQTLAEELRASAKVGEQPALGPAYATPPPAVRPAESRTPPTSRAPRPTVDWKLVVLITISILLGAFFLLVNPEDLGLTPERVLKLLPPAWQDQITR